MKTSPGNTPAPGPFASAPEPFATETSARVEQARLLNALTGRDAQSGMAVAERTRRAVRVSVNASRETRQQNRFHRGVAAAAVAALFLLLAPALWSGIDDLFGGEHFSDAPTQVAFLILLLFAATVGALIAGWKTRAASRDHGDA